MISLAALVSHAARHPKLYAHDAATRDSPTRRANVAAWSRILHEDGVLGGWQLDLHPNSGPQGLPIGTYAYIPLTKN